MSTTPPVSEQLRSAFVRLSENAVFREDCPSPDEIWRAVSGTMEGQAVTRIAAHMAGCFACAESWRIGREMCGPPVARVQLASPHGMKSWLAIAAAASVVIASGAALYLTRARLSPGVERAGRGEIIHSLLPEDQPVPREACLLRWQLDGKAESWSLEVGAEDLTHIASAEGLKTPEYLVARESLERLAPGSWILWRVEAKLSDGRSVASPTFRSRIR